MKKSEFIQDIASEIIVACCDNEISPMGFDKAQNIAEHLWEVMKKMNMYPPPAITDHINSKGYITKNWSYNWDPEDE